MRQATVKRTTKETDIEITINLDKSEPPQVDTGIGFFDHMLTALGVHSGFSLKVLAKGDTEVDCHHTIEDVGIVLGQAFLEALGDKKITRFGNSTIPMDESLSSCSVDVSGRAFLVFNADFKYQYMGQMETVMVEEFFRSFAYNARITLHINNLYGDNDHHKAESIFKAVSHALKIAAKPIGENEMLLSTKGTI
ncbi:MAG: imidazoleglycerol-phosphate dehydratase HisB [Oscillospiraceae bacterium]